MSRSRRKRTRTASTSLSNGDRSWVRCRRPMVMVGGELTLDSLELSYNPTTGFYRAPVQAIANGGVLVIDDFGRQRCSPRDLLNRWIVPLESRVDFLTLQSGQKFELPFMTMIVFATNIRPAELVDEAFLRRIQYKIFAESPTDRGLQDDLCEVLPRPGCDGGDRTGRATADRLLPPPQDCAARVPCPGSDQAGIVARLVSESPAASDHGAARSGVQQLLRQRPRGSGRLRLIHHAHFRRSRARRLDHGDPGDRVVGRRLVEERWSGRVAVRPQRRISAVWRGRGGFRPTCVLEGFR